MSFTYEYPRPSVTVDTIILTKEKPCKILLIQRGHDPFAGSWALPGGFLNEDEPISVGAARELMEETGLNGVTLNQMYTFGDPGRDPRGHTVSVVHYGFVDKVIELSGQDDASDAKWFEFNKLPSLAFDHAKILEHAKKFMVSHFPDLLS